MKTVYDLEQQRSKTEPAMASTETLQRTLAQDPREQVVSNGIMTAPLISGLASDPFGSGHRQKEELLGENIMNANTRIVQANTGRITHF